MMMKGKKKVEKKSLLYKKKKKVRGIGQRFIGVPDCNDRIEKRKWTRVEMSDGTNVMQASSSYPWSYYTTPCYHSIPQPKST